MINSIKSMLEAFEENHIIYCHWKSNEHLLDALNGDTDLDMLFLPEQRAEIDRILNSCGLKRFRATPLMQYNAIEDYIGFDAESAKIWHLHLHYKMTLGEKHLKGYTVTPWGYEILNNRIYDDSGIYTSAPEDELILLLVRMALKLRLRDFGKKIGQDDIIEFKWLKERVDYTTLEKRAKIFLASSCVDMILKLARCELTKKKQLKKLQKKLRKALKPFTGYNAFTSWYTRTKREIYWLIGGVKRRLKMDSCKPNRRLSPSGGCVVALLGCDGAGKSTTLEYIRKEFSKKIDVKKVYLGSGDGSSSILRKPMKLIAKKVGGRGLGHSVESEYNEKSKKRVSLKAKLYSLAKIMWAMTLASEKKKKLKTIAKARNNGMLVLVDRYPQTDVAGYSDGPLLSKYLKKGHGLLYRIALKELRIYESAKKNPPDLTLKLTVPTEIAIARKPEMTAEEIENKKAVVMSLNISPNTAIVDTSVDKTVSFSQAMSKIWDII